jgi:hypothetical protein
VPVKNPDGTGNSSRVLGPGETVLLVTVFAMDKQIRQVAVTAKQMR